MWFLLRKPMSTVHLTEHIIRRHMHKMRSCKPSSFSTHTRAGRDLTLFYLVQVSWWRCMRAFCQSVNGKQHHRQICIMYLFSPQLNYQASAHQTHTNHLSQMNTNSSKKQSPNGRGGSMLLSPTEINTRLRSSVLEEGALGHWQLHCEKEKIPSCN